MTTRTIGARIPRNEDPRLLQGGGCFVDDIHTPGMLHAAVLRSPHAHARIVSIDAAQARAVPGVALVLTAADLGERSGERRVGQERRSRGARGAYAEWGSVG